MNPITATRRLLGANTRSSRTSACSLSLARVPSHRRAVPFLKSSSVGDGLTSPMRISGIGELDRAVLEYCCEVEFREEENRANGLLLCP